MNDQGPEGPCRLSKMSCPVYSLLLPMPNNANSDWKML
jgi:hypothetical protein